jgi:hypothetical protein
VAVFTESYIILIDLYSEAYKNVSVVDQVIYDGVISRSGEKTIYLVYVSSTGLYRAQLSLVTHESETKIEVLTISLFHGTSSVCAWQGCPLLTLVDNDTAMAAFDLEITTFSISALSRVAPSIKTMYHPSRIVFQSANLSNSPLAMSSSLPLETMLAPSAEAVVNLNHHGEVLDERSSQPKLVAIVVSVMSTPVVLVTTCLLVVALVVAKRRKQSSAGIR